MHKQTPSSPATQPPSKPASQQASKPASRQAAQPASKPAETASHPPSYPATQRARARVRACCDSACFLQALKDVTTNTNTKSAEGEDQPVAKKMRPILNLARFHKHQQGKRKRKGSPADP